MSNEVAQDSSSARFWCPGCAGTFDAETSALVASRSGPDPEARRCSACAERKDREAALRDAASRDLVPLVGELSGIFGTIGGLPARPGDARTIDDLAGVHAVDGAIVTRLGIRSSGEGDVDPPASPDNIGVGGDDGDEDDYDEDEEDHDDEVDEDRALLDRHRAPWDRPLRPFVVQIDVLLVRIDGVVHAIWGSDRSPLQVTCVARIDSSWWPFRRDGIAADLAFGSPGPVVLCNFFRRPSSEDVHSAMVAVAEIGPAAGMIVLEAGLEWRSMPVAARSMFSMSSGAPLAPGARHRVSGRLGTAIRIDRIVISEPDHWMVDDIQIGDRSLLSVSGSLPGAVFSSSAMTSVALGVVGAGIDVSMDVSLVGPDAEPRVFFAGVLGETLEPRMQRYLHFFARVTPEGRSEAWLNPRDPIDEIAVEDPT